MEGKGNFKFKGLEQKQGGEFVNDKGDKIEYPASFALKVDEISKDGISERVFKLPMDSNLIPQLSSLRPYDDIIMYFDIKFYASGVKPIPVSVELPKKQ